MPIEFRCSQCQKLLRVPDDSAGKTARCPDCQSLMQVPAAGAGSSAAPAMMEFSAPQPAPGGAGGGNAPPPQNPFGEFGAKAPEFSAKPAAGPGLNPYAAPAGGYSPAFTPGAPRPGLPWEVKGQNFGSWWETAKLCMTQPTYAFSIMRTGGGLGQPMLYSAMGLGIGVAGSLAWNIPLQVILGLSTQEGGEALVFIAVQVGFLLFQGVVGVALGATLGLLIGAGITHVCLMIVGGARQPFETTVRVLGYAQGSTGWMQAIPIVGPLVGGIWALIMEIIGLSRAHEIPISKAVLAVLLPIAFCCVVAGIFVAVIIGIGAAAGAGAFR